MSSLRSLSRPLRTDFAVVLRVQPAGVVVCGKGGLGSGPGPKRGSATKWTYPSYVRSAKAKAEHRKSEKADRYKQKLVNLGFHECLICQEIILRRSPDDSLREVQCQRQGCIAYFHKGCADEWLKGVSSCPACKQDPMFEGGPTEAPGAAAFRNATNVIWEGDDEDEDDDEDDEDDDDDDEDDDDDDERHWVYDDDERSWMTIINYPGGQDETLYIKDFLVEHTTDRVLAQSYFDNSLFVDISDDVYYEWGIYALPMYGPRDLEDLVWTPSSVKGYYFLGTSTWGSFDGEIPDTWATENPSEIPLCQTIMNEANNATKVADVCHQLRDLRTSVVSLSYNTHNFRGTQWQFEYGGTFFGAIVKNMEDKGLVRGSDECADNFPDEGRDFDWPDGVDFVYTDLTWIQVKPSRLADYIESGGALW